MKKYNVTISKGTLAVWTTEIEVKATSKKLAIEKALKIAKKEKNVQWKDAEFSDDYNYQHEDVEKLN